MAFGRQQSVRHGMTKNDHPSDTSYWRDSGPGGIRTLDSRIRNLVPYPAPNCPVRAFRNRTFEGHRGSVDSAYFTK